MAKKDKGLLGKIFGTKEKQGTEVDNPKLSDEVKASESVSQHEKELKAMPQNSFSDMLRRRQKEAHIKILKLKQDGAETES